MAGMLIALEGIDGAGKTTQADKLESLLRSVGAPVTRTKEPTSGPWGQKLRDSASSGRLPPEEELALFVADRREHVANVIAPALERGDYVIVDRYYYSTAAYQGARGFDPDTIIRENEAFAPRPDLLVIVEAPVLLGLHRVRVRGDEANHFEREAELEKAAKIFDSLVGPHIARVDGTRTVEGVTAAIVDALLDGPAFNALCKKHYQARCEPAYCSVRLSGACVYVDFSTRISSALAGRPLPILAADI